MDVAKFWKQPEVFTLQDDLRNEFLKCGELEWLEIQRKAQQDKEMYNKYIVDLS